MKKESEKFLDVTDTERFLSGLSGVSSCVNREYRANGYTPIERINIKDLGNSSRAGFLSWAINAGIPVFREK